MLGSSLEMHEDMVGRKLLMVTVAASAGSSSSSWSNTLAHDCANSATGPGLGHWVCLVLTYVCKHQDMSALHGVMHACSTF